jgi:hypothetical protein
VIQFLLGAALLRPLFTSSKNDLAACDSEDSRR